MNAPMTGLGYRRAMADWDLDLPEVGFFEVAPENWLRRDRDLLHGLRARGYGLALHGVSLNLGGDAPLNAGLLREVRALLDELGAEHYSDHLAATGDAHVLHELFPVPFTLAESRRVAARIDAAQQVLGRQMAVENTSSYVRSGDLDEADFLMQVVERADCAILLDLNNIRVNHKNHGTGDIAAFVGRIDLARVRYLHVAGHEFDARFGMHIDTHSRPVEPVTRAFARSLARSHGLPVLLEWDHDLPAAGRVRQELQWLAPRRPA